MSLASPHRSSLSVSFAGALLAFALLGVASALSYSMTSTQVENSRWVEHTHTVIETIAELSAHLDGARRSERGYVMTVERADRVLGDAAVQGVRDTLQQLRALTRDNARQQVRLDRLAPVVEAFVAHADDANRPHAADITRAATAIYEGDAAMARIAPVLTELFDEELHLLVIRDEVMAAGVTRTRILQVVGTGLSVALLALACLGLRREIQRRVRADLAVVRSEAATRRLNEDLERRVRTRTAELETSNRELESFSYSVAHDLRTPLRGLSGFAEILLDDYKAKLDADGVDALHEIRDNARKMGILIDALLSLSRVTRSELKPTAVDLTAIVHDVVGKLQSTESRAGLDVVVAADVVAHVDPDLARALVENLVQNAWKFTSKVAAPRIEFGATEADGQRTFFVRDNGAGFDMAHAAKLFVPFHRLHTVAEFPGTGIGLSTVQRIVARSGGRIWADGQVDRGATFYFTLPANPEEGTS